MIPAGLRTKAQSMSPSVNIGKNGLNEGAIREINKQLKAHKLIKIKLLKSSSADKEKIITEILEQVDATVVQKVGGVLVLYKNKSSTTPKLNNPYF